MLSVLFRMDQDTKFVNNVECAMTSNDYQSSWFYLNIYWQIVV